LAENGLLVATGEMFAAEPSAIKEEEFTFRLAFSKGDVRTFLFLS
jgi:hypothetical protein